MIKVNIVNYSGEETHGKLFKRIAKTASQLLKVRAKRTINVVLCSNEVIHEYNRNYRSVDKETDVLSFPSDEKGELGDILISFEKAKSQAEEYGHSYERELGFLFVHGMLHCFGYDHMNEEDEKKMFSLQEEILEKCKLGR